MATAPSVPFLELIDVTRRFGGVLAVNGLQLVLERGTIHGLIGPNGSGKSTTFNLISGLTTLTTGRIRFKGCDITGTAPHRLAAIGIARTFQATDLFGECTVVENVLLASQCGWRSTFVDMVLSTRRYRQDSQRIRHAAAEILALLRLDSRLDERVRDLPHRDQKAVALANAIATGAELLLLDEPAAGLTHREIEEMMTIFRHLRDRGRTILLVEHNMKAVFAICDRITVLNYGEKISEGTPQEVARDPVVIEAYLGR